MLSIGKLSADQAKYYLDEAGDRVDVVESIGDGLEDYYLGSGEARGEWIGVACRELGLEGTVASEDLRSVLGGLDPRDGQPLRASTSAARVAGFDLTFSAPKSVSALFGVGNEELSRRVRAAHDLAVREAIGYLERNAAAVRRGHGGPVVEQASGLVAAAFRHRASRAGDPQLHAHVLVANLGRGVDGRWSALDGRRLYAHARTASFVYQAVLRADLTRSVGVEWTPVRRGIAEVVGVPRSVMRAFSRRRAEIDAALDERGTSGPRATEAAALATRRAKDRRIAAEQLVAEWRQRAAALGFGSRELGAIAGRSRVRRPGEREWRAAFASLAGAGGLTRRSSTFARGEVLQALCEALPPGVTVDARALEEAADRFLAERAVALLPDLEARADAEAFRRRDGRLMPAGTVGLRYSTPEQLALERRFVESATDSVGAGVGVAAVANVERAVSRRPTLSEEQRRVIRSLALDGDGVAAVSGRAGTGKTFALGATREAWQAAGFPVVGVTIARRAAAELQEGAGIASTSVAALLGQLRLMGDALAARCVLVVDEASMVPTLDLAEILEHVRRARGKLVLVGDERQLPELGAGGAFRALVQRELALELTENVRQVERWEREALEHLRAGRPEPALALYADHGGLVVDHDVQDRLVSDWFAAGDGERSVMIARTRADVADLNERARARLRDAGQVGDVGLRLPRGEFALGDLVVVKRNEPRLGVHNGQRRRVVAVDRESCSIAVACDERTVVLDRDFLLGFTRDGDPTLVHGYAITGHVAQGLTVDRSFVLASEGMSREWAYVALSRGRLGNRLYLSARSEDARAEFAPTGRGEPDPVERLAVSLRRSEAQVLAIDSGSEVRGRWLPGYGRRVEAARQRERAATRRAAAESRHGSIDFVTEEDLRAAEKRRDEQAAERSFRRERGIGREL